ncbi:MAG: TIGR04168 family protein [Planctomycetes bacterium]|nr:TIGR04168 family protein [Planctomycetota bacterium]
MRSRAEILVVGDLHGCWCEEDVDFLENGSQDIVLFVGDLGDEDVAIVERIVDLNVEKAVILGNHDAWQSFSNKQPTDKLRRILELVGDDHLAYGVRELPAAGISIVGARPFTWGGLDLRSPEVYGEFFGVRTSEESAARIAAAAAGADHDDLLVLAHNGPYGLGSSPSSIYGKDFGKRPGGDWGDRDLADALRSIADGGKRVRAVVAGHMHHRLHPQIGGKRARFAKRDGCLYLNPAIVPRICRADDGDGHRRHYLRMIWEAGEMTSADEIWVDRSGRIREVDAVRFRALRSRQKHS